MELSEFAIRLLLLFFPGVICAYIVDILTIHRPRSQFMFVLNSLLLGFSSYVLYWLILRAYSVVSGSPGELVFLHALSDSHVEIKFRELGIASIIGVVLGLAVTAASTYKVHFRIAKAVKLSKKFGELDVWGFVFNAPGTQWATVRDHAHNLVYDGWVRLFSDDSRNAELLLREVNVYRNDTGQLLYTVESIYLSLERSSISIEFRR